jgi:hypothetical protein
VGHIICISAEAIAHLREKLIRTSVEVARIRTGLLRLHHGLLALRTEKGSTEVRIPVHPDALGMHVSLPTHRNSVTFVEVRVFEEADSLPYGGMRIVLIEDYFPTFARVVASSVRHN